MGSGFTFISKIFETLTQELRVPVTAYVHDIEVFEFGRVTETPVAVKPIGPVHL